MLDKYILLNTKPNNLIRNCVFLLLFLFFIFLILILKITPYFVKKTEINFIENKYYLKLNINKDDLYFVNSNNEIIIDNKKYKYIIHSKSIYQNKIVLFLDVVNLPDSYKINNYQLLIKIKGEKKGLLNYLKEGEK